MGHSGLRVALLADEKQRRGFRAFLERESLEVVVDSQLGVALPHVWNGAQVLLVVLNETSAALQLESLLAQSPVPVVLNQGGMGRTETWSRGLLAKLELLACRASPEPRLSGSKLRPELRVVSSAPSAEASSLRVVVLGASMGGPNAVARFLRELPGDLPLVFLLAQHISEPFQELLAEQLDRCGSWRVELLPREQAQGLEPGRVWLLPAQSRVAVDPQGLLRCGVEPWESAQKPDINAVLSDAATTFGERCGAIMFSGLGGDGVWGCELVARHGGFVWAQSPESCAVASLPAAARRSGKVAFSGTPEQLARELESRFRLQSMSVN